MALVLRSDGTPLTFSDMDGNLLYLESLSSQDLIPQTDNTFVLGNSTFRWNQLIVGSGNIILNDTGNNNPIPVTVFNGVLAMGNVTEFNIGNLVYGENGISVSTPGTNIILGTLGDVGFVEVANAGIEINDSIGGSPAPRIKLINTSGTLNIEGASDIALGNMGYGTDSITFPDSSVLTTAAGFTSGSSGIDGSAGSSGVNGTSGSSGINGSAGSSGVNGTSGSSGANGSSGTSFAPIVSVTPVTVSTATTSGQNILNITIPAGQLNGVGKTMEMWFAGNAVSANSTAGQGMKVLLNSSVQGQIRIANGSCPTLAAPIGGNFYLTCSTSGASGAVEFHYTTFMGDQTVILSAPPTTVACAMMSDNNNTTIGPIDLTATISLQVQIYYANTASTSNIAQSRHSIIKYY